jgi:hypothetical protein
MKITATSEYKKAIFTWDENLTDCEVSALGLSDSDIDFLVENKAHEGKDVAGWDINIDWC